MTGFEKHHRIADPLLVRVKGIYSVLGLLSSILSVTPITILKQFYTGIEDFKEPITEKPANLSKVICLGSVGHCRDIALILCCTLYT